MREGVRKGGGEGGERGRGEGGGEGERGREGERGGERGEKVEKILLEKGQKTALTELFDSLLNLHQSLVKKG